MAATTKTAAHAGNACDMARPVELDRAGYQRYASTAGTPRVSHMPSHGRLLARMLIPSPSSVPNNNLPPGADCVRSIRITDPTVKHPPMVATVPPQYELSQ